MIISSIKKSLGGPGQVNIWLSVNIMTQEMGFVMEQIIYLLTARTFQSFKKADYRTTFQACY